MRVTDFLIPFIMLGVLGSSNAQERRVVYLNADYPDKQDAVEESTKKHVTGILNLLGGYSARRATNAIGDYGRDSFQSGLHVGAKFHSYPFKYFGFGVKAGTMFSSNTASVDYIVANPEKRYTNVRVSYIAPSVAFRYLAPDSSFHFFLGISSGLNVFNEYGGSPGYYQYHIDGHGFGGAVDFGFDFYANERDAFTVNFSYGLGRISGFSVETANRSIPGDWIGVNRMTFSIGYSITRTKAR